MTGELKAIFLDSISACHPDHWMEDRLAELAAQSATPFTHLFAVGKAAYAMAAAAIRHPMAQDVEGMIVVPHDMPTKPLPLDVFRSSHPLPDNSSIRAGRELYNRIASLQSSDRFLFLLSGGSSSLVEDPVPPLTLDEIVATHQLLLRSGLPIHTMNRVRTALSSIKGGKLAAATRASGTVLVMSDVPGNCLAAVGSGPLFPEYHDPESLISLLKERNIWISLLPLVRETLQKPHQLRAEVSDSLGRIRHRLVLQNRDFLEQIARGCRQRKIHPVIMPDTLQGEAREAGKQFALAAIHHEQQHPNHPQALIWGGETTVAVTGTGKGGRSQEACLSAILTAADHKQLTFLFAGTDGIDGPTDAAGAIAFPPSRSQADLIQMMETCLENQDSYRCFDRTGSLLKTGWTGINVMDVAIALVSPGPR